MSALPSKADTDHHGRDVRFVREADIGESLVRSQHHVGRIDDGVSPFALFELELVHRPIGNRGSDGLTADVNGHALFWSFACAVSGFHRSIENLAEVAEKS